MSDATFQGMDKFFDDLVYSYTAKDAFEDGLFVDAKADPRLAPLTMQAFPPNAYVFITNGLLGRLSEMALGEGQPEDEALLVILYWRAILLTYAHFVTVDQPKQIITPLLGNDDFKVFVGCEDFSLDDSTSTFIFCLPQEE
jgi:hypothetical protein